MICSIISWYQTWHAKICKARKLNYESIKCYFFLLIFYHCFVHTFPFCETQNTPLWTDISGDAVGLPSTNLQSIHSSPCTWLLYKTRNCQVDIPTTGFGHAFRGEQKMSLKTKPPINFILIPKIRALLILLWSPYCLQPWEKLRDEWRTGETLYSRCTRKRWESTGRLDTRWVNRDVAWLGSHYRQAIYWS